MEKILSGYVGFANLPNQVHRKAVKKGFEFSLMVVGASGLGKSTLINSLFLTDLYVENGYQAPNIRLPKTTTTQCSAVHIIEGGVRLQLTLVDTPGFGELVDNTECWDPILKYIDSRYEEFLTAESRINRQNIPDLRVHACLYFLAPNGHGLRQLDIDFMKQLHRKVNIVPVIAKADTFSPEECSAFKHKILQDIHQHGIEIYNFPDYDFEDEEDARTNKKLKESIPFAIIGSNTIVEVNSKRVRGRSYPWGVVDIENDEHCDFNTLRNMLVRTHMQDLKDITNNLLYERYRVQKLSKMLNISDSQLSSKLSGADFNGGNPMDVLERERLDQEEKLSKMEEQMESVFQEKVREKLMKHREFQADLQRRKEAMMEAQEKERQELAERRRRYDDDRKVFEEEKLRIVMSTGKSGKKDSKSKDKR